MLRNAVIAITALIIAGCGANPKGAYYEPSGERLAFDYADPGLTFADYVTAHRDYIARHRVYVDPDNRDAELTRIAPYEMPPQEHCPDRPKRGALLIHGVAGTAHAMKDIGVALAAECLAVKSLVLDGHATRVGDLLDVDKQDWIDAVDFGIRSLKAETDEVFVVGFSLGGLLAVHAATRHPDLAGLVLFAPALEVAYPRVMSWQVRWLRYVRKWVDVEPNENPVKYLSLTTDAAAEIVELKTRTFGAVTRAGGIKPPVLAYFTEYDLAIDARTGLEILHGYARHELSRFIYYLTWSPDGASATGITGGNVDYRSSYFPDEKILNFSHFTFVHAPHNPVLGENGSHRDCGQEHTDFIPPDEVARCFALDEPWKGELGTSRWGGREAFGPLQRLTYHPRFAEQMAEIAGFMDGVTK